MGAAREVNCRALAWDGDASGWVGVLNNVNNKEPHTLIGWTPEAEFERRLPLRLYSACEFLSGRFLVTSDGEVRDTRTGLVAWQFAVAGDG